VICKQEDETHAELIVNNRKQAVITFSRLSIFVELQISQVNTHFSLNLLTREVNFGNLKLIMIIYLFIILHKTSHHISHTFTMVIIGNYHLVVVMSRTQGTKHILN